MAEKTSKTGVEKLSVKSYQQDIEAEKQQMKTYAKKMKTNVKSLQASFKSCSKEFKVAALKMREDGLNRMRQKVGKFNAEIKDQIKENKGAVSRMADNVKLFQSEVNKKSKDFQAYARGPFQGYI